jgi:probable HAF family extracellular repeat protein
MRLRFGVVFSALLLLIGITPMIWAQKVSIYDLGHYPGGTWAEPRQISESGVVVGFGDISSGYARPLAVPLSGRNAGQWFDLGTLGGDDLNGAHVMAMGIADTGMIVGHSAIPDLHIHAFAWTSRPDMTDLGVLAKHAGGYSLAYATNKSGTLIVGWSSSKWWGPPSLPVVWIPKAVASPPGLKTTWDIQELDTSGFPTVSYWYATGVNDAGQIIGTGVDSAGISVAVLWSPLPGKREWTALKLPASPGYPQAWPNDINSQGDIVGGVAPSDGSTGLPVLWAKDSPGGKSWGLIELATVPGSPWHDAMGINDRGDIVGDYATADWNWFAARWDTHNTHWVGTIEFPGTGSAGFWSEALKVNNSGIAVGAYGTNEIPENAAAVKIR